MWGIGRLNQLTIGLAAAAVALLLAGAASAWAQGVPAVPEPAPLAPEPHEVRFGFNEDWAIHADRLGAAAELGATIIRQPTTWKSVDAHGWARFDRLYAAAARRGIRMIWEATDAPCWAHDGPCTPEVAVPPSREYLDEFQEHLREVVRRYPKLAAVEIWNEPNLPRFYGDPDPRHYVALLRAGYEAVKSVRPDMPVLFGGLFAAGEGARAAIAFDQFVRRTHRLGAGAFYDAMSFHSLPTLQDDGYLLEIRQKLARLRQEMARGGAGDKPVWITEVGVWTGAGEGVSEDEQAERLVEIYQTLRRVPPVAAVLVHRMFDSASDFLGREWGVVHADKSSVKPAFCALARLDDTAAPEACDQTGGALAAAEDALDGWIWPAGAVAVVALVLTGGRLLRSGRRGSP